MSFEFPASRIQIFCKAPITGEVKTRLIPHLGEQEATQLHERLATRMVTLCQEARLAPVELWCAPDTNHDFFALVADSWTSLHTQKGDDLGERMANGVRYSLEREGAQSVVVIGTDCPTLDTDYLRDAFVKLQSHDAVIGPAEDGGYGLIGLKVIVPDLFAGIPWGSPGVCSATCRAMNEAGLFWSLLPLVWDVDRPEDLARLTD